jgi:hypothetical protein
MRAALPVLPERSNVIGPAIFIFLLYFIPLYLMSKAGK